MCSRLGIDLVCLYHWCSPLGSPSSMHYVLEHHYSHNDNYYHYNNEEAKAHLYILNITHY